MLEKIYTILFLRGLVVEVNCPARQNLQMRQSGRSGRHTHVLIVAKLTTRIAAN